MKFRTAYDHEPTPAQTFTMKSLVDLTSYESLEKLIERFNQRAQPVVYMVNNIQIPHAKIEEIVNQRLNQIQSSGAAPAAPSPVGDGNQPPSSSQPQVAQPPQGSQPSGNASQS